MNLDKVLVCSEESSNKFWGFKVNGNSVLVRWGRLGLDGDEQTKEFRNQWDRDDFIEKKTREKRQKGYREVTPEELAVQVTIAKIIGVGKKVDEMIFVAENGSYLQRLDVKDLHKPGVKPLVYARIIGRKPTKDQEAPVTEFLFDTEKSYVIKAHQSPSISMARILEKGEVETDDTKLAEAVGQVIGQVLL